MPAPDAAPPSAAGPALTACDPVGRLDLTRRSNRLTDPVLALAFDRPMDPDDLARPSGWLRVFRMKRVPFNLLTDLSNVGWAFREFQDDVDETSLSEAHPVALTPAPAASPLHEGGGACPCPSIPVALRGRFDDPVTPGGDAVFLVLIDPGRGYPRAAGGGPALAVPYAGTSLTAEEFARLWDLDPSASRSWTVPIDWRHLIPRASSPQAGGHGPAGGRSHAVFYLGHPHGFDAPEDFPS